MSLSDNMVVSDIFYGDDDTVMMTEVYTNTNLDEIFVFTKVCERVSSSRYKVRMVPTLRMELKK